MSADGSSGDPGIDSSGSLPITGRRLGLLHAAAGLYLIIKWIANTGLNPGEMVMPVHDFLDSYPGWYVALKETGTFFALPGSTIPSIFDGLPRTCLKTSLKLDMLPYFLLSFPWGYAVNLLLGWVTAYAAFWLLSGEIVDSDGERLPRFVGALMFATIPFYPGGPFTPAALCLAVYAAVRILRRRNRAREFAILFFVPFMTPVVMGTYMILFFLGCFFLVSLGMRRPRAGVLTLAGLGVASAGTVLSEIYLFSELFQGWTFQPHRAETIYPGKPFSLDRFLDTWLNGQYHAPTFAVPWLAALVGAGTIAAFCWKGAPRRRLAGAIATMIAIAFAAVFFEYARPLLGADSIVARTLRTFNLSRLTAALALVWCLAGMLGLVALSRWRAALLAGLGLAALHIAALFPQSSYVANDEWNMIYNDFHLPENIACVERELPSDKSDYRVVSVGLHPSVAQSHGFYTFDGYVGLYPLEFKRRFREVIAAELEKNDDIRDYFENWGSRAYVFSSELGRTYMVPRHDQVVLERLEIRTDLLYQQNVRYLLSSVAIGNAAELGLELLSRCNEGGRPYEVFLYALREPEAESPEGMVPPLGETTATESRPVPE